MGTPPTYHRGRSAYDKFNRRADPVDPFDEPQIGLLVSLGFDRRGAENLIREGNGNIFNLVGRDTDELEVLPGVGPGTLNRLVAEVVLVLRDWEAVRDRILATRQEPAPSGEESQGDVAPA